MNIHEYQAKQIFRENDIAVPGGIIATSGVEAEFAYRRLKSKVSVVKAQIHAGGRGKGGGVKLAKSPEESKKLASEMLGMNLVTHQTGPEGKVVGKVYIEEASEIKSEYYLALLVDRESASIVIMFSTAGGVNIEDVAEKTPEKIVTVKVDPTLGLQPYNLRDFLYSIDIPKVEKNALQTLLKKLFSLFIKYDFSMIEINPLVVTSDDRVIPLDGKMNFDDNALYRQFYIESLRDFSEEDLREVEASKYGLSYIGLEGNIGCMVNGAGLAMATMDIIKLHGGDPANFLDVGGGATEEMVHNAFSIILKDEGVKAIFVNIFGGIMRCDVIAKGIVSASEKLGVDIPLVVRLEGTNVDEGKKILSNSSLQIISADDMADGAKKAVAAVKSLN